LSGWERAGLVAPQEEYSFFDLLKLQKLRDLAASRVRPKAIRESLVAIKKQVAGLENPLVEAGVFMHGSRIAFRHSGAAFDPVAGQFMFDFEPRKVVSAKLRQMPPLEGANELFARAVALEEDPQKQRDAMQMYLKVIELEPAHAAAYINLGTMHYNRHDYPEAERCYRKAIEIDERYSLAYFDLGNVLDETGRLDDAILSYKQALAIAPNYADAHYNIALAYERLRNPRRALSHWRAYLKMDSVGPWANHARSQVQKIQAGDNLKIVWRRGQAPASGDDPSS
jgi:tetratricopeptide (TPR) repeat protein